VPLAKALCKDLPADNTQRQLSRPKPTRVAVPIEEEEEEEEGEEEGEEEEEEGEVNILMKIASFMRQSGNVMTI